MTLVTGATGKTGAVVVAELLKRAMPVRALVHREDERADRLRGLGAEVVVAQMHDHDQLARALTDVKQAYYVPLLSPHSLHAAMAFAVAARNARIDAVVQMSQWLSHPAHPSVMTRETWLIDRAFAMIPNLAHVIVNPGMFADNFLRTLDLAALLHIHPVMTGDSRSAPISNEDLGRVIAALLVDPRAHAGRRYRPTGAKLLTGSQMADAIAAAVGHRVIPVRIPFWLFRKVARMDGVDPHVVLSYREYLADHRAGAFEIGGGVTDVVEALTGTPAESFETTARRYAAQPFARQTWSRRLRAFVRFNLAPFWPGYDLDRYSRQRAFPVPPEPSLAADDARWREEHLAQHPVPSGAGA
ncbi:MAG: NmrA family NAD(P)-binding protein [Deltaproteobacteria bacterium]|nr:NmrA family NAD(P)-binding protein [Nannocystaceae bacterium]